MNTKLLCVDVVDLLRLYIRLRHLLHVSSCLMLLVRHILGDLRLLLLLQIRSNLRWLL